MRSRMTSYFHTVVKQGLQLGPRNEPAVANVIGHNKKRRREMIFRERGQRVFELRHPSIVEGEYHRQGRQLAPLLETIRQARERDPVVAAVLQKFHLLTKDFGGYGHSPQSA